MIQSYNIHLEDFSVNEICDYLEHNFYKNISLQFDRVSEHINLSNLYEKDNDASHSTIRLLVIQLFNECNLLIKNDVLILFPKIRLNNNFRNNIEFNLIQNRHSKILLILNKIKILFNNYAKEPFWNMNTQVASIELQKLENTIQKIIYIKEEFLFNNNFDLYVSK